MSRFTILSLSLSFLWYSSIKLTSCLPLNEKLKHYNSEENDSFNGMYSLFGGGNPIRTPNGLSIVEGDIVISNKSELSAKKATADTSVYWPNGEVIYSFHESITQAEQTVILAAMQHWQQHTCVSFRPRQLSDMYFIRFRSDTQGCWSLVGRQVDRAGQGQDVSIGTGCANINVVTHEIGHVLGFYHEQSRSDRDQYIHIVWNNVQNGYALQFRKESDVNHDIPYDLTSTMQYPQWAFSKQLFEKSTIVALNPAYQRFLSKNYALSFRDRKLANIIYSCSSSCSMTNAADSCLNGGYARTTTHIRQTLNSDQCSCDCPPNYSGSQCESSVRQDYYETLPCGGVVNEPTTIETPGYPQRTAPYQSCMWDITAKQPNQVVKIEFEGFEFAPRFSKAGTKVINKCFNETVEIRTRNSDIYDGDFYCGTDIAPGSVFTSDGPRATIIIIANDKMLGSGLRAKVTFVSSGGSGDEEINSTTERPITIDQNEVTTRQPSTIFPFNPFTIGPFTFPPIIGTLPPISIIGSDLSTPTSGNIFDLYDKEKTRPPPLIPLSN